VSIAAANRVVWTPWPERLPGKSSISPLWAGLSVSLATLLVLGSVWGLTGEMREFLESDLDILQVRDARLALILCALVGFLPASQQYLMRATRDNLRDLEPLLARGAESLELARPSFWLCILPGLLVAPAVGYGIDRDLSLYLTPEYLSLTHLFQWSVGIFCAVNLALSAHLMLECASALQRRADAIPRIDLLDLASLAPFARQSVQGLFVSLLGLSIFSINATDSGFFVPLTILAVIYLAPAIVAALRCNQVVHRRIQQTKREELARVNAALRGDREAGRGLALAPEGEGSTLSVADLLAYRRLIEESREWALDTSAWLRSALYLAIPLGSWLGGALVERALEASLGHS
jgi:hypothetical protein